MPKITIIGAGSMVFCKTLIADILNSAVKDVEFCLMDLNAQKLEWSRQYAAKVIAAHGLPARVTATSNRREAIADADYVINTFHIGGLQTIVQDYEIPMKYGVDQCIGDTLAPGGIFRGLRVIPIILDMAGEIEELSPNALVLNYVNPMSIVGWALGTTKVNFVGLCHGVQVSLDLVASYTGVPKKEITFLSAGINHMAWFLKLEHKGRDLYPELREKFELPEYYANEKVRGEVFRHTGYFMTESTGHLSEYLPYFRKNRKALDLYCNEPMFGGESGAHVRWAKMIEQHYGSDNPLKDEPSALPPRGIEYGSYIIEAMETGIPFHFQGNVINQGMIANLPQDSCVEGPMYADGSGLHKTIVGNLPSHLAALNLTNVNVHRLTVEACLSGDPEAIVHACALDPLTSAALTLKEIREMASEMLETQRKWLPQFEGKSIRPTPTISIPKDVQRVNVPVDPALAIVARFDEIAKQVS
jgi:alpha-galactosidase